VTAAGSPISLGPGEGDHFSVGADQVTLLGSTGHSGDGFSVVDYRGAVGQAGPPMHVHHTFEECWIILEGEVQFRVRGDVMVGRPGSFLLVPRETPHTFQVLSPARWLGIFSPARYVGLIEDLGQLLAGGGPPTEEAVLSLFQRYDTDIVA
jgi:mannose-6-phosphate isomerase-like protein (cupin superfamily)